MVIDSRTLKQIEEVVYKHHYGYKRKIVKIQMCEECGFSITIKVGKNIFELKDNIEEFEEKTAFNKSAYFANRIYRELVMDGIFENKEVTR